MLLLVGLNQLSVSAGSPNQNRSISQPRALLQTVNVLRRFQKSIPWPLLTAQPTPSWLAALRVRAQFCPLTCRRTWERCLTEQISDTSLGFLIPGSPVDPVLTPVWVLKQDMHFLVSKIPVFCDYFFFLNLHLFKSISSIFFPLTLLNFETRWTHF